MLTAANQSAENKNRVLPPSYNEAIKPRTNASPKSLSPPQTSSNKHSADAEDSSSTTLLSATLTKEGTAASPQSSTTTTSRQAVPASPRQLWQHQLLISMATLYNDPESSDVCILVGDNQIFAHSLLLNLNSRILEISGVKDGESQMLEVNKSVLSPILTPSI